MADSPQMTAQINKAQNNPIDFLKTITDLLVTAPAQQNKAAAGLEAQDKTIAIRNAYQKGVDKALSEHGYKQGTDALVAGVDPNEIANHEAMQPTSPNVSAPNPDHVALLGSLLGVNTNNTTQNVMDSMQQQAADIVKPATSPLGKLLEAAGFGTQTKAKQLNNLAKAQQIESGQPAEIAVPLAQAAEINQKIAGAVPLQQADIVKLNVDTYGAALKANQEAYTNSNAEVANLSKTLETLQNSRSVLSKSIGGSTDFMNQLKAVIAAKTLENQKIGKNQKMLIDNAPKVGNSEPNKIGKYSFTKG